MTEIREAYPDTYHDTHSKTVFGFWLYLVTDYILFATLFATYAVLNGSVFGGPSAKELFSLPFNHLQTIILLTTSLTSGMGGACAHRKHKRGTLIWFTVTLLLGIAFTGMQFAEFIRLFKAGHDWAQSAFLSAYFTLVGTFALHMIFALMWIFVLIPSVCLHGITGVSLRRLTCLRMFWQFLGIIWIFIFAFVYLMGVI